VKEPKDPRSTWRKRARAVLIKVGRPEVCEKCGRTNKEEWEDEATGGYYPGLGTLQANHKNKILEDIDPANLEWLCPSCHKEEDSLTEKGVSRFGDEWGYGIPGL
jgi:ribosomal protein L37AE/L43A